MKRLVEFIKSYKILILIISSVVIISLPTLGRDLLSDWDECIYTQYSETMKSSKNFMTHYWNGKPAMEKPTLNSILMQGPMLFGTNEFTARLTTFIMGILTIISVYFFLSSFFSRRSALLTVLILLSSDLFIYYLIRVNTDIGFTLFVFLGFFLWIHALEKSKKSYLISGVFFGLAVLQKGPAIVPYLIGIFFIQLSFFRKEMMSFFKLIGVALIIALPWHIFHYFKFGKLFVQIYILENIIQRAKYPIEFHIEGRLFYIKLILKQFKLLLLFPVVSSLVLMVRNRNLAKSTRKLYLMLKKNYILVSIISIFVVTLISITRIRTRIAWYALPLLPFISIIIALSIEWLGKTISSKKLRALFFNLIVIFLIIFALTLLMRFTKFNEFKRVIPPSYEVFIKSSKYPQKKLNYLVRFSERQAREILTKEYFTSTTWIFGGNPCALYYSNKEVNYIYKIDEFEKKLKKQNELFLIENGDLWVIEKTQPKILLKNSDFTLFTY